MSTYGLPNLRTIRTPRHPGITDGVCESFSEAAEVALDRHHEPPRTDFAVRLEGKQRAQILEWETPSDVMRRAWNNHDDATRDGAYILAIAAVEAELGLVALARAETRTGADYYVAEPGSLDFEMALRLEVSGVDAGTTSSAETRLKQKLAQARRGASNLPAMATVVAFREALILMEHVGDSDE